MPGDIYLERWQIFDLVLMRWISVMALCPHQENLQTCLNLVKSFNGCCVLLFTCLIILMQLRSSVHVSTTQVQLEQLCSGLEMLFPGRVRASPLAGGIAGASFQLMESPAGVQWRAACLHFPSAGADFSPGSWGPAEDSRRAGLPQFSCCAVL